MFQSGRQMLVSAVRPRFHRTECHPELGGDLALAVPLDVLQTHAEEFGVDWKLRIVN